MANEKGQAFSNIASGLGSLGGVASTVAGIIGSIGQHKRQKDLMDYQYQKNLDLYKQQFGDQWLMYERQLADQRQLIQEERDYNDFSSVAARARAAGVNPLAIFGNGGVGIQSASGSTPNSSVPGAGSVSIPGADNIGGNLIAAGSTITNIARQSALLDAEIRSANAQAQKDEVEAYWKGRDLESIILNREEQTKLASAGIKEKEAQTRWYTLDSDLKEQLKQFNESMNPKYLTQMDNTLRQQELMIEKVEFENEHQAEAFRAKMNESRAFVDDVYSKINERLKNLELRAQELNLSKEQLDEVRAKRQQVERHFERSQSFYEKQDEKRLTHEIARGYIGEANKFLSTCADVVTSPVIGSLITSQMY